MYINASCPWGCRSVELTIELMAKAGMQPAGSGVYFGQVAPQPTDLWSSPWRPPWGSSTVLLATRLLRSLSCHSSRSLPSLQLLGMADHLTFSLGPHPAAALPLLKNKRLIRALITATLATAVRLDHGHYTLMPAVGCRRGGVRGIQVRPLRPDPRGDALPGPPSTGDSAQGPIPASTHSFPLPSTTHDHRKTRPAAPQENSALLGGAGVAAERGMLGAVTSHLLLIASSAVLPPPPPLPSLGSECAALMGSWSPRSYADGCCLTSSNDVPAIVHAWLAPVCFCAVKCECCRTVACRKIILPQRTCDHTPQGTRRQRLERCIRSQCCN